ncbi:MAG: long-chain fatty acid--CoA ligase, partial [Clostridia bacterium]|nr:long-chain fatty acid--CoA ligase [Clostridia bacterium]
NAVPEGCRSFREAVDLGDLRPSKGDEPLASRCPVGADDIMRMAFTSGTTGDPKAVVHTYNTTLCVPRIARSAHAYDENAVLLIFLPVGLNWGFLNLVEALYHGARAVLVDRFDAGRVLRLIQAERVTHFSTSPTALIALLNDPGLGACDLTSLRLIVSGGASCPVEVIRQVQERFPARFLELYGMLETGYHTFTRMEDDPVAVCGKVGRPADGMGLRILDDEGRDLPPGEVGEIACFGPSVTIGYNRNPEANARSFTPDGWFLTGDLGVVDESGNLQIVGRKKDMIIRGGANIYPRELEEILFTHPKVLNVAVVGLPDPYLGERTCACIIPKPGETLTLAEVVAFLEGRIARYKLPQHLEIFQDFPLTPTGKVRKFALRELVQHRLQAGQKGDDGSGQG